MGDDNKLGRKLSVIRESLRLSQEEVAERSGCDVSVIVGLEGGKLAPSLAPLLKITRALGCRLGTLLDDDTDIGPVLTRSGDAESALRLRTLETASDAGVLDFFSLASGKVSRHMEPFIIDVAPSQASEHEISSHEGEEFIYVLDGSIHVVYGKQEHVLETGDSIYYDSIVPHEVRANGDAAARILAVVYAPV